MTLTPVLPAPLPFSNEQQARAACAAACAQADPSLPRLKTISCVGAFEAEIGSEQRDSVRLAHIIDYMLRSGFLIDPEFSLDVVNFADRRDFLEETNAADLLFISFIIREPVWNTPCYSHELYDRLGAKSQPPSRFGTMLSQHHEQKSWRERAQQAGAKMIVTYGGIFEIGTPTFCKMRPQSRWDPEQKPPYVALIESPAVQVGPYALGDKPGEYDLDTKALPRLKQLYNDQAADVPLPWLGFCAAPAYVAAAVPGLQPVTRLGQSGAQAHRAQP